LQIGVAYDGVAAIDPLRPVPSDLHGDRARDPLAFEVADGGTPEVVRDAPPLSGPDKTPNILQYCICGTLQSFLSFFLSF
jgi:hypothetical protein